MQDFALDLKAHHEEEDSHQPVIDQVAERVIDRDDRRVERNPCVPEIEIAITPRRIRPQQRRQRRAEEDDAARRLRLDEFLSRPKEPFGDECAAGYENGSSEGVAANSFQRLGPGSESVRFTQAR